MIARPVQLFRPQGLHRVAGLEPQLYRNAAAIEGVADIMEFMLLEELPPDLQRAFFVCCDVLSRVSEELFLLCSVVGHSDNGEGA